MFSALQDFRRSIGIIATGRSAGVVLIKPSSKAEIGNFGIESDGPRLAAVEEDIFCRHATNRGQKNV